MCVYSLAKKAHDALFLQRLINLQTTVAIEKIVFGGQGLGRLEDKRVVFVDGALPGDKVLVEITQEKNNFLTGHIISFVEKSALRGPVACRFFDSCGGCQWLGIPYNDQANWKKGFILDSLTRIGKIKNLTSIDMESVPEELHYRNRVLLRGRINAEGHVQVGYFGAKSKNFSPIDTCLVAKDSLNHFIFEISQLKVKEKNKKFRLHLQEIPFKKGQGEPHLIVLIETVEKPDEWAKDFIKHLGTFSHVFWAGLFHDKKSMIPFYEDTFQYFTSPGIFQQINLEQNKRVRQLVTSYVTRFTPKKVLDLFCGNGNLSMHLPTPERQVIGIEVSVPAITVAHHSVKHNEIKNASYFAGNVLKFMKRFQEEKITFDFVIADPPRAGMKEIIPFLKFMLPKHILYVSCNPTTLARDIGMLGDTYHVEAVTGFDFFPQTFHVETVVLLTLKI